MSFHIHAMSHDNDRIEPILPPPPPPPDSPTRTSHSRSQSESKHLLNSPKHVFEYSSSPGLPFGYPVLRDVGRSKTRTVAPQTLKKGRKDWVVEVGAAVMMAGSSLPFFAVAAAVMRLNGQEIGVEQHSILEQSIRGAATLFPLVYSVVVGRATVKCAGYLLERGTTVGLLERLMGSQTVGGTLITQWRLRSISLLGLGLILLWSLSPLGGQAVLRILSTSTRLLSSPATITYINTRQPSYAGSGQFVATWFPGFATLFSASLLAPEAVKNGTMDLWGNVKIPYFSSLSGIPPDSTGWRHITLDTPVTYSSLFGIPIAGLQTGNTTFDMQSTYLKLTCTDIESEQIRDPQNPEVFEDPGLISTNGAFQGAADITNSTRWALGYFGPEITSLLPADVSGSAECLDCLPEDVVNSKLDTGLLLYQDFTGTNLTSIYCVPQQVYIESRIQCTSSPSHKPICRVTAQRLSPLPHPPPSLTPLSFRSFFLGLATLLPLSTLQIPPVDLLMNYLSNPTSNTYIQSAPYSRTSANSTPPSTHQLSSIPLPDFSLRLAQLLNAFHYGSLFNATQFLTGAPFATMENWVAHTASFEPALSDDEVYARIRDRSAAFTVPGTTITARSVYVCNWMWMALFLVATAAVPAAAVVAGIVQRRTLMRGYLGFVSSLVREGRWAEESGKGRGGVKVDGMERARGWMGLRVRLGDVGDVEGGVEVDSGIGVVLSVGRLGLGDEEKTGRVNARKLYV